MPTFDSGRAASLGGINIRSKRGSDLNGIRFADNRTAAPTSANDMVLYRVSNSLRFWDGSTEYNLLTSVSGSVGDLNGVYENGSTITVDEGAIVLNDGQATANTLTATKSGTGSGHIFSLKFENAANTAARAIYIDMDDGIAAEGIEIDSGGTARTGSDIVFTDDSTGAHSVLDINSSGSGASVGLDWTDSYNGSDASFGVKLTLDDNDGIDSTALQIVRGAGIRTVPAIDINDGSTGSAHLIDIDLTGAFTGNVIDFATAAAATGNVIYINLDNAVAMTALHIEGSGVNEQPFVEIATDGTGAVPIIDIVLTGATHSGNVIAIGLDAATTGNAIDIDMNAGVGARALFLDAGGGARTANLVDVTYDSTGNLDLCEITDTNTGSGHIFDINVGGAGSGNVLDITYGAALDTGDAIGINLGATAVGAQAIVIASGNMTRTTNLVDITESGTASGHMIDLNVGATAYTGDMININIGATAVASQAIVVASGNMIRTTALFQVTDSGASTGPMFDLNRAAANEGIMFDIDDSATASTGNVFDYGTAVASTGTIFEINMTTAVGAIINNYTIAGVRTANAEVITHSASGAVDIIQIDDSGTSSGHVFDINESGNSTGNVIDIVMSGTKVAGHALHTNMGTDLAGNALLVDAAGVRTAPLIYIANTATDAGTDDHVLFINQTGQLDSNLIQLTFGTAASTGEAISISMGTNLAGSALVVNGTGVRTDDLIKIDDDSTGNSHIFDINLTGIYTGNVIDIAFATAAATGEALMIAMGTNVAGRAIAITSAGTGVSGEGSALDITHTGILVAGANIVDITATGAISSTSNALSIATIGDAGSYAVYINATGSAEGLKVDAGGVVFDETLLVTGVATFTAKPVLPILTELNTTIDTHSTAAAINSTATATAAEVATGRITSTSAAATTITLPTGTLLGGELSASAGDVFDLVIDNSAGASTVTIAVAVNGVLSTAAVDTGGSFGDLTVASGVTGVAVYRIMFTSATAYAFTRVA